MVALGGHMGPAGVGRRGDNMAQVKEKTAAEQVQSEWQDRRRDFDILNKAASDGSGDRAELATLGVEVDPDGTDEDVREQALQVISEYPLAFTPKVVVRVDLSTGGPGDWLEAILDSEGRCERISYHFAPWFDHAEITLDGDDFDAAERFIEALYPLETLQLSFR